MSEGNSGKLSTEEVAALVARGEIPADVRQIDDKAPDPTARLPGSSRPRLKPWEQTKSLVRPIFVVDSFTSRPFRGNPAAVCLISDECRVTVEEMLCVAREMAHSETAFVVPLDAARRQFALRWFTPDVEVDLCGHATLATAHVLFEEIGVASGDLGTPVASMLQAASPVSTNDYLAPYQPEDHAVGSPERSVQPRGAGFDVQADSTLTFVTRSGELTVRRVRGPHGEALLAMDLPAGRPAPVLHPQIDAYLAALQLTREELVGQQYCAHTRKLLLHVKRSGCVLAVQADREALLRIPKCESAEVRGVIVTAQADAGDTVDIVSRYFAPWVGIPEDPVTGSAHTVLAVYWSERLDTLTLRARQASLRGGELHITLLPATDELDARGRVVILGEATTVLRGQIRIR